MVNYELFVNLSRFDNKKRPVSLRKRIEKNSRCQIDVLNSASAQTTYTVYLLFVLYDLVRKDGGIYQIRRINVKRVRYIEEYF